MRKILAVIAVYLLILLTNIPAVFACAAPETPTIPTAACPTPAIPTIPAGVCPTPVTPAVPNEACP
ncbi:MAG: hypothetical protein ACE14P_10240, partial [Methanotrichaceae archaeon]